MSAAGQLRHPLVILAVALVALPFAVRAIGMTDGIATEIAIATANPIHQSRE